MISNIAINCSSEMLIFAVFALQASRTNVLINSPRGISPDIMDICMAFIAASSPSFLAVSDVVSILLLSIASGSNSFFIITSFFL